MNGPPDAAAPTALTKIVATVGPATAEEASVLQIIESGAAVLRMNFSHGDRAWHEATLARIRRAVATAGRPVAVLGDLPGPKIRVGPVAGDGIVVETGATVVLQREPVTGGAGPEVRLSCTHPALVDDVQPGERLLVDDGRVRLLAVERREDAIACSVMSGGTIRTGKGINVPETALRVEALTDADRRWAAWAVENDLDFIALSFVRRADDVRRLAEMVANGVDRARLRIVAKIERPEAVENIESIAEAADALMVARGDLGVEMDIARVPVIQRRLLETAQSHGKPCIVATQMLESMIEAPSPTRAEASDVANAIFDGADAIMLSGETAIGAYPSLAVAMANRIAIEAERYLASLPATATPPRHLVASRHPTAALAHGVWTVTQDVGAAAIVAWSQEGGGARILSQMGFAIPIVAASTSERALRRMQLYRGVIPIGMALPSDLDAFTRQMDAWLLDSAVAGRGDRVILMAGEPIGRPGVTNRLAIHTIGDPASGFRRGGVTKSARS
jgi:pyruvate kinase